MKKDWLATRVKATPEKLALIIDHQQWSYAELNKLVDGYCQGLAALGIQQGDPIGVFLPNCLEYVCLIHALARMGAVLIPLNIRLTSAELEWQLRVSGCRLLISQEDLALDLEELSKVVQFVPVEDLRSEGSFTLDKFPLAHFNLNSLQAIVFTSGTTGRPKGAMLTHANHFWSATASAYRLGAQTEDRWLACLPLYHVGGLAIILRSCLYGTAIVLQQSFDPEAISYSLDRQAVTLISLVPTMLHRLIDARQGKAWPDALRLILLGGAAASTELIARCAKLSLPVATTYGLTEASSQVATMLPQDVRRKPGSVGRPLMFTDVEICDDNDQPLPADKIGEIVVSGPTVAAGYYQDSERAQNYVYSGRLHTGDMGYIDKEGDLWVVQRRMDIIISGGENIFPAEVENVIRGHPAVEDTCVVGIQDIEWGQRVAAMVAVRPNEAVSESQIQDFCRDYLAGYKIPRFLLVVESLPETSSGKIRRQVVVDQLQQASAAPLSAS